MRGRLWYCFLFFILIWSCNRHPLTDRTKKEAVIPRDTIHPAPVITYHALALKHQPLDSFYAGHQELLLALNRIDLKHLHRLDTLVVPDSFFTNIKVYSPFPDHLQFLTDVPKLIFYSYRVQAFGAYENGKLIRWGPVSMGKESTPTPTGLFHTNWRAKETRSTVNNEWIMKWYFNLENKEGVSMHEYELPGYPASHACVRLSADDAYWFYNWCDSWKLNADQSIQAYGTPVIIYGVYHFGRKRPWLALPQNNKATTVTETELEKEVERFKDL